MSHNSTKAANTAASFADFRLDPRIERAVQAAGFASPTPVQASTIPIALKGRDIIGTAQTGTGKTAAFVLPILQHLVTNPAQRRRARALVVTPTRELAEQVADCFRMLSRFTKVKTATVYGGVSMRGQEAALRAGVDVIVACPGRLLDHMDHGNADLSGVEKLVLDEADRMLDMGFLPPIRRILSKLPSTRHSMLFSATFAPELNGLAAEATNSPQRVDIGMRAPAETVTHALYPCPQHLKGSLVVELLGEAEVASVLIFTRTKHRADQLARHIERAGYPTAVLHSNRSQNQRQAALNHFRSGECQVLVATDIAARGLDVERISHVINFDIPDTVDAYIHRIGRAGRAERDGDAMTLVTEQDADIVRDIEWTLDAPIERRTLDGFDYEARPQGRPQGLAAPAKPAERGQRRGSGQRSSASVADRLAWISRS